MRNENELNVYLNLDIRRLQEQIREMSEAFDEARNSGFFRGLLIPPSPLALSLAAAELERQREDERNFQRLRAYLGQTEENTRRWLRVNGLSPAERLERLRREAGPRTLSLHESEYDRGLVEAMHRRGIQVVDEPPERSSRGTNAPNEFARNAAESEAPGLWRGLVVGTTGSQGVLPEKADRCPECDRRETCPERFEGCPWCGGKVQALGENSQFCLDCDWDNLEPLT